MLVDAGMEQSVPRLAVFAVEIIKVVLPNIFDVSVNSQHFISWHQNLKKANYLGFTHP